MRVKNPKPLPALDGHLLVLEVPELVLVLSQPTPGVTWYTERVAPPPNQAYPQNGLNFERNVDDSKNLSKLLIIYYLC